MSDIIASDERHRPRALPDGGMGSAHDFFELLKPRVMSLVIFTALAGLVVAPGSIHPVIAFTALLCIAVGAGASGALNMWYDADIDAAMARTAKRPIPAGRVTPGEAAAFGSILSVLSVMTMGVLVNWVAAALLAFTIFFYAVIYTMWLKRRTPQNIVIGGAAGAFPPMIGWAAVTGSVSLESAALFLIIFMWTPPHFWALALYRSEDYKKAGVPMLPVVAGEKETRRQIMLYSLALVPVTLLPGIMGFAGLLYTAVTALLGIGFLWFAFRLWRTDAASADGKAAQDRAAKGLFGYSILYLFLIFSLLLAEKMLGLGGSAFAALM
ncbi:MAG: protoheme IX farnesyltransferase [Alphaproteobacteria bacterium HGW-Alphaproteobacteria-12]|nr:MAG: protoheme IX farnesyltransferase [Alphaproteobacteria bacterium HGW-Alphaproteobacteria-12]